MIGGSKATKNVVLEKLSTWLAATSTTSPTASSSPLDVAASSSSDDTKRRMIKLVSVPNIMLTPASGKTAASRGRSCNSLHNTKVRAKSERKTTK